MTLIFKAAQFAAVAHMGQVRKGTGTPYVYHPARVAARVAVRGDATEEMVAAAFLHDVLEDTDIKAIDLVGAFSSPVVELVIELTNHSKDLDLPRKERKRIDLKHLAGVSGEAKIIKMLDRIDNLREMDPENERFVQVYAQESWMLVQVLADADVDLAGELKNAILDLVPGFEFTE